MGSDGRSVARSIAAMSLYTFILTLLTLSCLASAEVSSRSSWLRHCEEDTPSPVEGEVVGHIPDWLEGRLIRVGPGIQHIGNTSYKHLFDGLALLHMVQIQDGQATYTSRFLESDTYKKNMKEERIAVAEFGTAAYPDPCKTLFEKFTSWFEPPSVDMTDNCLVNVLQAKDQLIAMTETDTVRIVDPSNLQIIGQGVDLGVLLPVERATAHPHVDKDGTIYNVAFAITDKGPGYSITSHKDGHVEAASIEATILARWKFNPAYMHSFAITENYYVVIETPLAVHAATMIALPFLGYAPENGFVWYPNEKVRFRVIKRENGEELDVHYMTEKFFAFHHINAYEIDNLLVVDVCATSSGEVIKSLYLENIAKKDSDPTKLKFDSLATRYVMPVKNTDEQPFDEDLLKDVHEVKIVPEDPSLPARSPSAVRTGDKNFYLQGATINDNFLEMPRINYDHNGQTYQYVYGVGTESRSIDFSSIVKIDVKSGKELVWSDPDYFVSEPIFMAEPGQEGEDSGVVLTILLHKEEEKHLNLLVLDARDLSEIARAHFDIPGTATPTFHGQFVNFNDMFHGY